MSVTYGDPCKTYVHTVKQHDICRRKILYKTVLRIPRCKLTYTTQAEDSMLNFFASGPMCTAVRQSLWQKSAGIAPNHAREK